MSAMLTRLVGLLKELFELDQPDLDFGMYRVLRLRSAEITAFLEETLPARVREAFGRHDDAQGAELKRELAQAEAGARSLGIAPESVQKIVELRAKVAGESMDRSTLESEVYDHLHRFFRRYYQGGDFLSRRVYKDGVYAIPYQGEEVLLHWANKDQYYVKTSEAFRNYSFRLRPSRDDAPMRVHFDLVDADEGEHANVKATAGKERRFVLAAAGESGRDFVCLEAGELHIRFEYRKHEDSQDKLVGAAIDAILGVGDAPLTEWLHELGKPQEGTSSTPPLSKLLYRVRSYVARNQRDYFIHKDLGAFLRGELEYFLKSEVLQTDDLLRATPKQLEGRLASLRVIREIGDQLITFLAQLEDFQKRLWLKKKFVTETSWCVTLDRIGDGFYSEIAACDAQREAWVRLYAIDQIRGDLVKAPYSVPLTTAFLRENRSLVLDTRHFSGDFTARLLASFGDLDEATDGVVVHSENFQALNLLHGRYRGQVKCVYIDPPYNTGSDGFAYRDSFRHSSWYSLMADRLSVSAKLLNEMGSCFVSTDDVEQPALRYLSAYAFGGDPFIATIIWNKVYSPKNSAQQFSEDHDFITVLSPGSSAWRPSLLPRTSEMEGRYENPDSDPRGPWKPSDLSARNPYSLGTYSITCPSGRVIAGPPSGRYWSINEAKFRELDRDGRIWWGRDGNSTPSAKRFLTDVKDGRVPQTLWKYDEVGHTQEAKKELISLIEFENSGAVFETPKPSRLIMQVARVGAGGKNDTLLDYFAGSGTTGHAVINLNREDGGRRKFILVEMADYFDTVLLPRLMKVTYSPEWDAGKPKRAASAEEIARGPGLVKVLRLESYEDTLNNLELRRPEGLEALLSGPKERAAYLVSSLLEIETRGSASLVDMNGFADPTRYQLTVKPPGRDESRRVAVDLVETLNLLLGLRVKQLDAPETFIALTRRSEHGRLEVERLKPDPNGPHWLRVVTGTDPEGRRVLVVWRRLTGAPELDNAVLDHWFDRRGHRTRDGEFDLIYVNGDCTLENLRRDDESWKVRRSEAELVRLMFEASESSRG